jgi:hypothetical protein
MFSVEPLLQFGWMGTIAAVATLITVQVLPLARFMFGLPGPC